MKRNITPRIVLLVVFFGFQILGIFIGKFTDARFFCWAPYDQFSIYEMNVRVNGQILNDHEVFDRYRRGRVGRNNRSIHNVISILRQFEKTYSKENDVTIELSYIINGHQQATWLWPEDQVISQE